MRLMLAAALGEAGELCVCDLSWIAERPENLVSHHLRALRSAGLRAFGWWWLDPIAALVIAGVATNEGLETWRGEPDHGSGHPGHQRLVGESRPIAARAQLGQTQSMSANQ